MLIADFYFFTIAEFIYFVNVHIYKRIYSANIRIIYIPHYISDH